MPEPKFQQSIREQIEALDFVHGEVRWRVGGKPDQDMLELLKDLNITFEDIRDRYYLEPADYSLTEEAMKDHENPPTTPDSRAHVELYFDVDSIAIRQEKVI